MTPEEYISIYEKHMAGQCSPEEEEALKAYIEAHAVDTPAWDEAAMGNKAEMEEIILSRLQRQMDEPSRQRLLWPVIVKYAAAILIVALSAYYIVDRSLAPGSKPETRIAMAKQPAGSLPHDIAPGGNKAVLTLDNGRQVILDDTQSGLVARQGSTTLRKEADGLLQYETDDETQEASVGYNTVTTPRGGQYQITLPDGSNVWLNASSSIRFPTRFHRGKRQVEVTGEVFFEVRKDAGRPFCVTANDHHVEVLGTTFNVMAYHDEAEIKTTLVEGSVRVRHGADSLLLKPGEQCIAHRRKQNLKVILADLDEALAWQTGQFIFNDEDLESIMRKVARWYDVEIDLKGDFKHLRFTGGMSRFENVSKVLNMLALTGSIHFNIKERRIEVMP